MRLVFVAALSVLTSMGVFVACGDSLPLANDSEDAGADVNAPDVFVVDSSSPPETDTGAGIVVDAGPCATCASNHCETDGGCDPLVFVTHDKFMGDFGADGGLDGSSGVALADRICTSEAKDHGINSIFRAWLSGEESAIEHATTGNPASSRRVWLPNGTSFTASYNDLTNSNEHLLNAPDQGLAGAQIKGEFFWTGTNADGSKAFYSCTNWMTTFDNGMAGSTDATLNAWTQSGPIGCTNEEHLLCLEVGP